MTMIKKLTRYSILLLMVTGWILNGKYYFSRFISEGFEKPIAVIVSVTLVVFASLCFYGANTLKSKNNGVWVPLAILYIVLAIYSINCTTAGQYWDQQTQNQKTGEIIANQENAQYLLSEEKRKKAYLENERDRLTAIQSATIINLDEVWSYQEEYDDNQEKIDALNNKIETCETNIKKILEKNNISAKSEEILRSKQLYEFYYSDNPEIIQFCFQVLLSIFIESIAQVSIYLFLQLKRNNKNRLNHDKIDAFSVHAWKDIHTNQGENLVSKKDLLKITKKYDTDFNGKDYDYIVKLGLQKGLLKRQNGNIKPNCNNEIFYKNILEMI